MRLRKRYRLAVPFVAVVVCLAASAGAIASGVLGSHAKAHTRLEAVVSSAIPFDLQNAFVVFQRARTAADAVSDQALNVLSSDQAYGIEPMQSRLVVRSAGLKMWLVPGPQTSCLIGDDGLGGCAPNAVAETRGLVGGVVGGAAPMWFGVMPSAIREITLTGGSPAAVSLNADDGFVVASHGAGLSFVPVGGSTPITIPGGAPTEGPTLPQCPTRASWCK